MTNDVRDHYAGVLHHLERRRNDAAHRLATCRQELAQTEALLADFTRLIDGLKKTMPNMEMNQPDSQEILVSRVPGAVSIVQVEQPSSDVFANLSTRWAILALLGGEGQVDTPLNNDEIALKLLAGGFNRGTKAKFRSNLNAVLSRMTTEGEVYRAPVEGYALTPMGVSIWKDVKNSPKFQSRHDEGVTMFSYENQLREEPLEAAKVEPELIA